MKLSGPISIVVYKIKNQHFIALMMSVDISYIPNIFIPNLVNGDDIRNTALFLIMSTSLIESVKIDRTLSAPI